MNTITEPRSIATIAADIKRHWPKLSPYAAPYLEAMECLHRVTDNYYHDSGRSVVLYFLSNATSWRGDDAKRIKAELKAILAG